MKLVAAAIVVAAIALCCTVAIVFRWDCDAVALTSGGGRGLWNGNLGTGLREPGGRELGGRWDGELSLDVGSRESVVCVDRWSGDVALFRAGRWTKASDLDPAPTPAPTSGGFVPLATPTPKLDDRTFTLDGKKYRLTPDGRREPIE